jgi:hypothetical protein
MKNCVIIMMNFKDVNGSIIVPFHILYMHSHGEMRNLCAKNRDIDLVSLQPDKTKCRTSVQTLWLQHLLKYELILIESWFIYLIQNVNCRMIS